MQKYKCLVELSNPKQVVWRTVEAHNPIEAKQILDAYGKCLGVPVSAWGD